MQLAKLKLRSEYLTAKEPGQDFSAAVLWDLAPRQVGACCTAIDSRQVQWLAKHRASPGQSLVSAALRHSRSAVCMPT